MTGIASALAARAEPFGLKQDFRTVGAPALLVTNEITPAGFYEIAGERFAPDGYIFGPGCGNVISMVEAFASAPRGLVMVDVDPAVVWAGRILIAALVRHVTAEAFVDALFCRGPELLGRLAEEVLAAQITPELQRQMGNQRDRLRAGLGALFPPAPVPAQELLAGWAAYHPPQDRVMPVRTFIARNYARLREMALDDRIAMLWGSIFDTGLLALVTDLPGFRESRNLVYLSNAADHVLRRGLLATAQAFLLGSDPGAAGPALASPEDSLRFLNEDVMPALGALASGAGGAVFVYSKTRGDLALLAQEEVPQYGPGDLEFTFRLDHAIVRFLDGVAASAACPRTEEPWRDARRLRGAALGLFTAALQGDARRAEALLRGLEAEEAPEDDPRALAFRIAELSAALLRTERAALALDGQAARESIAAAVRALLARRDDLHVGAAGQAMSLLLYAQAFALAGVLLDDEQLGREAEGFLAAALALQTPDGILPYGGRPGVGPQAEGLLRLAVLSAHRPDPRLEGAMIRGAAALLPAVRSTGEINLAGAPVLDAGSDGYLAYATDAGTLYETVRLALLFQGLALTEMAPVDAALRVGFHASHKAAEAPEQTHVLVDESL
ncbi:MAG TPA: hypothetical protein VF179_32645 [Thermoanaerobaculia bacterium]|nr:hypothetical protein [Thermoanaerobaculia bacterium]